MLGVMKVNEQQYIVEAEKKVFDIKGLPESIPKREINTVGVIGAGTMGGGIAMNFAITRNFFPIIFF